MRVKYVFLTTIIFVVTVFGQPRIDTSNIGLVLKISLQRDTIFLGEPLILTSTLINKSSKPIEIMPIDGQHMTECSITVAVLVEPSGKHDPYGIGRTMLMTEFVAGFNTKKLLPNDSVYWRELFWLEKFDEAKKLEDFSLGRYWVINNYNYNVSFKDKHIVRNSLYDSTSFILLYNSRLVETIKLIPEYMKNFFWYKDIGIFLEYMTRKIRGVVSPEALVEYLYQNLLKIRRLKSPFTLYADYLLPAIASFIKYRRKRAIILAEEFMKKYPSSPLCEEMAFWKGKLAYRQLPMIPERDSIMEERLKPVFKKYPKNAYRFAFHDLWKKLDESKNTK